MKRAVVWTIVLALVGAGLAAASFFGVLPWALYLGAAVAVIVAVIYLGFVGQRILDASNNLLTAQEDHNEKQEEIINRLDHLQRFFHREIADTADNLRKIVVGEDEQSTTGRHSRGKRTA